MRVSVARRVSVDKNGAIQIADFFQIPLRRRVFCELAILENEVPSKHPANMRIVPQCSRSLHLRLNPC